MKPFQVFITIEKVVMAENEQEAIQAAWYEAWDSHDAGSLPSCAEANASPVSPCDYKPPGAE